MMSIGMDFDRPWLKHGLLSDGGVAVFGETKNIFCYALAIPDKRQRDPDIYCSCDFLM